MRSSSRGPPGTHDKEYLDEVVRNIKEGKPIKIPVFDKSLHGGQGDRSQYKQVDDTETYDFCIFEGWFNGLQALPDEKMADASVGFAHKDLAKFSNDNLRQYGEWEFLDKLFVLKPLDFKYSFKWRLDAEKAMGKGMTDEQIHNFVSYFIEAINPDLYYQHMYESKPANLALEFQVDDTHRIVSIRSFE